MKMSGSTIERTFRPRSSAPCSASACSTKAPKPPIAPSSIGGFGSFVLQALAEHGALDRGLKVRSMVLPDIFIDQDSPNAMYAKAGLDAKGIVAKAFEALGQNMRGEAVKLA